MPANVGQMFYYGDVPWHGEGTKVDKPLTVDEAIVAGGLAWEVGHVALQTAEEPPGAILRRKAVVRHDRPAGSLGRVLGVVHPGFRPVQNRDGARLLDNLLGPGKAIYHTGGYLGDGEVVWLMAKLDRVIEVARGDLVEPYALFVNSHDGSRAVSLCLTTIRVTCQNTLNLALKDNSLEAQFRRAHQSSFTEHQVAAQDFWKFITKQVEATEQTFRQLAQMPCSTEDLQQFVNTLLPLPNTPATKAPKGTWTRYENQRAATLVARARILELSAAGQGADLPSAQGTLWGALNAATEFVDHQQGTTAARALLGKDMAFKQQAYKLITDLARQAL